MIIDFFGIQLQIVDNGDGTFDVLPVDTVADKQLIRDEIARLKSDRDAVIADLDAATLERDYHVERRDVFVAIRNEKQDERTAINARIQELRDFVVAAGDPDPGV